MTNSDAGNDPQNLGELDDQQEAAEESSDQPGGAAAAGEYDAAEGSPDSGTHPGDDDRPGA